MQLLCAYAKLPALTVTRQIDREAPVDRGDIRQPRQVRHRLGTEAIDLLCASYLAGKSTLDLAREFGVSKQSVSGLLRQRGVAVRSRGGLNEAQLAEAARLYQEGLSAGAVGRMLGCATSTVYHALRRAGVPTRDQRKASHLRWGIDS